MTAAHIREAGEALFGPRFQSDLARLLGVSGRTVRRWCNGEWEPRPFVWDSLRLAMQARVTEIQQAQRNLPAEALKKAPLPEIEITPEMIEAGAELLRNAELPGDDPIRLAREVLEKAFQ